MSHMSHMHMYIYDTSSDSMCHVPHTHIYIYVNSNYKKNLIENQEQMILVFLRRKQNVTKFWREGFN